MEIHESKLTSKNQKKTELKQRIFTAFNPLYIPNLNSEIKSPNDLPRKTFENSSTPLSFKKENILQKFSEKCLDKLKPQQTSNEPILNYRISISQDSPKELIKPVALRPKNNPYTKVNTICKRSSIDYLSRNESFENTNYNSDTEFNNLNNNENSQILVFANRTNRTSRFIDRRSMNCLSMNNNSTSMLDFNGNNYQQKSTSSTNLDNSSEKNSNMSQKELTNDLIASTVNEITNYFANSENLYEQTSTRPHLNLIKMKIQNLIENSNDSSSNNTSKKLNENSNVNIKTIKEYLSKRENKNDRFKSETQSIQYKNDDLTPRVKLRTKSRKNHFQTCSFSLWRSSPSLFPNKNEPLDETKLDLDKIENDLN